MTYLYTRVNSLSDMFNNMGRAKQFSYEGLSALHTYLEELAADTGTPIEIDVIALCCDYSEYADVAEYNAEYGTEYETWDEVSQDTTVIPVDDDSAIVQNH